MYLADYHTHSDCSPDASFPMTQMALAAVEAGLDELCFTDHLEPVTWTDQQLSPRIPGTSSGGVSKSPGGGGRPDPGCVWAWSWGMRPELCPRPNPDGRRTGAGFRHWIGAYALRRYGWIDLSVFNPEDEAAAREGIADYLTLVQEMAKWGKFSVLGHLTLPLRYLNEKRGFHLTFDGFEAQVEAIFRALIENGCGIELNTNRGNDPLPGEKWLRMYRQLGGEIITLGSDAHSPNFVGCAVRQRQELLRACGFTRFCTFEKMRPVWHAL